MIRRESHRIWRAIVGLTILVSVLGMSSGITAQASEGCPADGSQIAALAHKALAPHGRVAEFNTLFVPGNKTAEITLHEPYEQASKYTFYAAVSTGEGKESLALAVLGIDKIVKDDKVQTRLIVSVPGAGWLWPRRTFFVLGCTADGKPALAAELAAAVSNRVQSALLAILFIAAVYTGVAFGCRAPQGPWTLNPIRLTTGLTGRGSISNLQTFFFTLIVVGLVAYSLTRRGVLSDLSPTVVLLLGIVAGGTVAARWTDNLRAQLSGPNLKHLQVLQWLPQQIPSLSSSSTRHETLVSRDGELDVTRMQALAFSLVVGVALVIRGATDLAHFEVPENLLMLMFASQAIYVGGKWVQPGKSGEQFAELNKLLDEMRALELKVRQEAARDLVVATSDTARQDAIKNVASFGEYHAKASTAAEQVANLLDVPRPTSGLFGIPI